MFRPIAADNKPIILVGNGQAEPADVGFAAQFGDILVAADGGAELALAAGFVPDAVVGDLDSLPQSVLAGIPDGHVHRIEAQDTNDFQKCLARIEAPAVIAVGFLGGRLDHHLASLSALLGDPRPVILVGAHEVACLIRHEVVLDLEKGADVALYPLKPLRARSHGLKWNVDGPMAPDGLISTSNSMVSSQLRVTVDGEGMLLMVPRTALQGLLGTLI